jgi:hypothetical protein
MKQFTDESGRPCHPSRDRFDQKEDVAMTTLKARAACISAIALLAGYAGTPPLQAQTAAGGCGILTWSVADQRHSVLPCTAPTPQSAEGKATCGIASWSNAEQKHTVLPCASTTEANGKDTCTLLMWSQAEQRYVSTPCDMPNKTGLAVPIQFGE